MSAAEAIDYSVVCFDIGIKNLAYCHLVKVAAATADTYEIAGWENVNLLTQGQDVMAAPVKTTCYGCKVKATYEGNSCSRHTLLPPLVDLSGNKITKLSSLSLTELKTILIQKEPTIKKTINKCAVLDMLRKHYTLPIVVPKAQKAPGVDLSFLHDCLRDLVAKHSAEWSKVTEICLENQPVFKNPQMKSVQMLLFATIRDILQPGPPTVRLVHAGMKGKGLGAAAGDEGYKDRKKGSENRVAETIKSGKVKDPKKFIAKYESAGKKNDLADAFCMSLDAGLRQKNGLKN